MYAQLSAASLLQNISIFSLRCGCYAFPIGFDGLTASIGSYSVLRVRFYYGIDVRNYHTLSIPPFDGLTGENMFQKRCTLLEGLRCSQQAKKLINVSMNGTKNTAGDISRGVTRLKYISARLMYLVWCRAYELNFSRLAVFINNVQRSFQLHLIQLTFYYCRWTSLIIDIGYG